MYKKESKFDMRQFFVFLNKYKNIPDIFIFEYGADPVIKEITYKDDIVIVYWINKNER